MSLMMDAVRRVEALARERGASRVVRVRLTVGALTGLSAAYLRRHFSEAARGTAAENARLEVRTLSDVTESAQDVRLESIEVEE